ncbi:hypothetical protein LTR09_005807 [Extremus antarcticus]|uniref:ASST-domain-containing protein n=1 Tax=Extremus antarcticus TaxID=702011 RepID=A0AAJ0GDM5_9PEZI|nr:hypothetical protein LTR09_005807 [Extremus antarcticus]
MVAFHSRPACTASFLLGLCFSCRTQAESLGLAQDIAPRAAKPNGTGHGEDKSASGGGSFFKYVTRPDIGAPRWNIKILDEDALAPGYWFLAPYANLGQVSYPLWNGPHIYDQTGELIWSGAPMFDHRNTHDFKTAMVNDQLMMTLVKTDDIHEGGVILDNTYNIHERVDMRGSLADANMHDFTVRDNGHRALFMTQKTGEDYQVDIGDYSGPCNVGWQGFRELNMDTRINVFKWNALGHIPLNESTKLEASFEEMCTDPHDGWDILHFNAVDKFTDGDYLISARHTDTVYKISHKDGKIVWKLGGRNSDFEFPDFRTKFTRQHHVRFHSQNETHQLITLMNNAAGHGHSKYEKPSSDSSWGLYLALNIETMKVDLVARFQHPLGEFTTSRGSVSILPNENVFVGWTYRSVHSEHAPDGRLLMYAEAKHEAANTYRAYKLPWVGKPSAPPVVHSAAMDFGDQGMSTMVYVSWNGDTETKSWNLLHTAPSGDETELIATSFRQGFETVLSWRGYAKYVRLVALDADGKEIGKSNIIKTIPPRQLETLSVADEAKWLADHSLTAVSDTVADSLILKKLGWFGYPIVAFTLGFMCCAISVAAGYFLFQARARSKMQWVKWWQHPMPGYKSVPGSDDEEKDQWDLDEDEGHELEQSKHRIVVTRPSNEMSRHDADLPGRRLPFVRQVTGPLVGQ